MKIGVLGAGMMTEALAAGWVSAGHDVLIGGRTPEKAADLAERIGARAGTLREAAEFGDAVLIAVRLAGVEETLRAAGAPEGSLAGKTVIDCGNAVDVSDFSQVTYEGGASMAEEVARLSPGAHVIKAFNQAHAAVWRMRPPVFDDRPLAVPFAGDENGKATARALITDLGAEPLDAGDIRQARHLEAMAIVVIRLLFSGYDPLSVFAFTSPGRTGE
ncbi:MULTISPECIES: NAD(P)-binding domain-containing protein [unclassified Actinomadura]|uniref:NADPH-dependent F420 reductase n=1 Tax=unclassified Actinomadura TaxID=2626254 RepID=UPI0011EC659B|nr:NAD(P)-binding domain-containing protein [Actinomadura sp. K4S16]